MLALFPIEPIYPPGFIYEPDYITEEAETDLMNAIHGFQLKTFKFGDYEARRKVASFG